MNQREILSIFKYLKIKEDNEQNYIKLQILSLSIAFHFKPNLLGQLTTKNLILSRNAERTVFDWMQLLMIRVSFALTPNGNHEVSALLCIGTLLPPKYIECC